MNSRPISAPDPSILHALPSALSIHAHPHLFCSALHLNRWDDKGKRVVYAPAVETKHAKNWTVVLDPSATKYTVVCQCCAKNKILEVGYVALLDPKVRDALKPSWEYTQKQRAQVREMQK